MRRRGASVDNVKPKKPKTVKTWDRDIICMPQSRRNMADGGNITYPRGKYRAHLASLGLIGKLHLTSEMTDDDVVMEICTVFKRQMTDNLHFPFLYLQATGGGSKSLTIPSQSSSFKWTPQQVARLSTQSGTMYILAKAALDVDIGDEIKVYTL